MKKRILILFASFVLLLSLLTVSAAAADAELRVIAPERLPAVGEEFTVTVEISGNPGIVGVRLALAYDKTMLACTDIENGSAIAGMMSVENPNANSGAMIAAAAAEPDASDGIIATFKFKVQNSAAKTPRDLAIAELNALGGDTLAYTLVQMNEQGTVISSVPGNAETPGGGTDQPNNPNPDKTAGNKPDKTDGSGTGVSGGDKPAQSSEGTIDQPLGGGTESTTAIEFPDVAGHWGESYVAKAAELGLFTGFEDGSFRPDGTVTRGQFVTVLWRMAGKPTPTEAAPFTDAQPGAWYADAVAWAHEKGYVNGRTETSFDPDGSITRQEAMKILFAYNGGVSGAESMFTAIYDSDFTDSGEIAAWAKPAMYWGYYKGIINGKTATTLCPTDTATRAELAKILVVYSESVNAN